MILSAARKGVKVNKRKTEISNKLNALKNISISVRHSKGLTVDRGKGRGALFLVATDYLRNENTAEKKSSHILAIVFPCKREIIFFHEVYLS